MLSQAEINALIAGVGGGVDGDEPTTPAARVGAQRHVKTYDFRRPDKFSKDQLRTLSAIHENIGRIAGARLSARLRTPVTFVLADTAQMIFDEFIQGLTLPTQLVVLHADQLDGPFLLDMDLGLAQAFIERLLGGAGRTPAERREPTSIEAALILRLIDDLLPAITEAWAQMEPITPTVAETALSPSLLRVAAPSHVVAVLTYEVRFAGNAESLSICLPHETLEPVLSRLSATAWYAQVDRSPEANPARADIALTLADVEVPITAVLGGVELTVDELASLKAGDVIRFGDRADQPVRVSVMDQAGAWAMPGKVGDRIALRLLTPLQQLMEA